MPSVPWRWLSKAVVLAIHAEQLAEHGGAAGLRDEAGLDSGLARPKNLAAYTDPTPPRSPPPTPSASSEAIRSSTATSARVS